MLPAAYVALIELRTSCSEDLASSNFIGVCLSTRAVTRPLDPSPSRIVVGRVYRVGHAGKKRASTLFTTNIEVGETFYGLLGTCKGFSQQKGKYTKWNRPSR